MRTQDEIQKAHDCLIAFILGEAPEDLQASLPEEHEKTIEAMATALCWVLDDGDQPGKNFAKLLAEIYAASEALGNPLVKKQNAENQ